MDVNKMFDEIVANSDAFDGVSDDCPLGDGCSIHFRNDERYLNEEFSAGRFITYVGEYAVVTQLAPLSPAEALKGLVQALAGTFEGEFGSDDYETTVEYVGPAGALVDNNDLSDEEYARIVRYRSTFDSFDRFAEHHDNVAQLVRDGRIDLDNPASE